MTILKGDGIMDKCCGNCKYHRFIDGEWICTCKESDGNGFETSYDDHCGELESRESEV